MRLLSHISIEVSTDAAGLGGPELQLSSFLGSDHWVTAKPCFMLSFFISFGEGLPFPLVSQAAFLKQLGKTLSKAEVSGQSRDAANADLS